MTLRRIAQIAVVLSLAPGQLPARAAEDGVTRSRIEGVIDVPCGWYGYNFYSCNGWGTGTFEGVATGLKSAGEYVTYAVSGTAVFDGSCIQDRPSTIRLVIRYSYVISGEWFDRTIEATSTEGQAFVVSVTDRADGARTRTGVGTVLVTVNPAGAPYSGLYPDLPVASTQMCVYYGPEAPNMRADVTFVTAAP